MKVYIEYTPPALGHADLAATAAGDAVAPHPMTLKITLPKSWYPGPVRKVKELFVESYNKKFADGHMVAERVHVVSHKGVALPDDAVVEAAIAPHDEIKVALGAPPLAAGGGGAAAGAAGSSSGAAASTDNSSLCRNYGCGKKFREEENGEGACRHHVAPPLFHETRKSWGCCPDRTAWDWDGFMQIEGCKVGRHSTVDPKVKFAASPTVAAATATGGAAPAPAVAAVAAPAVKSIADFNTANPTAASAASSAARVVASAPKRETRPDGSVRCVHKGCMAWFQPADNTDAACCYHAGQPIFHDGGKSWSCCPGRTAYEFDEFMAIPGCVKGPHEGGV
jgi:hypothetical protein